LIIQTRTIIFLVRSRGKQSKTIAVWQFEDAKARLSEVIARACREGPQTIARHGAERTVVLSIEDYHALTAGRPDFRVHLLGGPKVEDFVIERDRSTGRDVDL
jgi:prevent-host-death family protein